MTNTRESDDCEFFKTRVARAETLDESEGSSRVLALTMVRCTTLLMLLNLTSNLLEASLLPFLAD